MQQNGTPGAGIEPRQVLVLEQLLAGASITRAAQAAGVDRTSVHRWLREDWSFQAAYNAARRDLMREIETRLVRLAEGAVQAVERAVRQGDVRAALAVLKGLG